MFIRITLAMLLLLVGLYGNAQNKKPVAHLGSAPLSSGCVVANLPPDMPDTLMHIHPEPEEPGERDPKLFLHKHRLPKPTWNNYFEDQNLGGALNKTNSGDLVVGAQAKYSIYTQGTPPDNTMAISNDGKVVASINVKIGFFDSTGTRLLANERDIATFISDPTISQSELFDPRVIYDPKADRFIYVVMFGSTDLTSKLIIGFSQTKDPMGAWKFYKLPGDFDGSNSWFDYPSIAVTDQELIITGNLFYSPSNNFNQSIVVQVNKADGYSGAAKLNYRLWDGITDASGSNAISLVPAPNGSNAGYGPSVYLISNTPPSSNQLTFYEITNLWNVPSSQLIIKPFNVDLYSTPTTNASQKGTTKKLDIQKNRIRSVYFANGILHYAFITPTNTFGTVSAIAYGRYDIATGANKTIYVGATSFNFAFPAITHFSNLDEKNTTLLTYLVSNSTIYPEIRAVSIDENMVPSTSVVVKTGLGFVNYNFSTAERWGDYTGIARKYNSNKPEAWVFGCYGETSNKWGNYIAQITATADERPMIFLTDTFYFSPNPTFRYLNLNVNTIDTASFRLKIYSMSGQVLRDETASIPKGTHVKTYDLQGLSPAEYIIELYKNDVAFKASKIILLGK